MRIVKTLEVARTIRLPSWNDQTKDAVVDFWCGRGFAFSELCDSPLRGIRGSIRGNLLSFDMSKVKAALTITWKTDQELECVMEIDGRYQDLTEWNEAYWKLELQTMESFLLHGDMLEKKWQCFNRAARSAAIRWCFSMTLCGRSIPQ